jgi:hypothetical protein
MSSALDIRGSVRAIVRTALLVGCGGALLAQTPAPVDPVVLDAKFDAEGLSQFLAPVRIAGTTFWCSIDSGGSWVLSLDTAKARRAGLQPNATGSGAGVGPDVVPDQRVRGVSIEIGSITLSDITVVLRAQPGLVPDIDCVFGVGLLQEYAVEFDYTAPRLRIFKGGTAIAAAGVLTLPFELDRFRNPYVEVTLTMTNGGEVHPKLILDTGTSSYAAVLVKPFIDANGVLTRVGDVVTETTHTPGLMLSAARIRGIALGGVRIEGPVVGLVLTRSAGIIEDGTLGAGFFRRFTATFDYSRRELRLVPNDRFNERQPFDASGLDFAYSANQDFVINGIATDSPGAAAGLMEGDRLLAIDDREARTLTIGQIKALLSRPGLTCSIRVDRRGETRTAILHLMKRL